MFCLKAYRREGFTSVVCSGIIVARRVAEGKGQESGSETNVR